MAARFPASSQPALRYGLTPSRKLGAMEITNPTHARVRSRDAGLRLLQRLTFGAAAGAVGGVGVVSASSGAGIPGSATCGSQVSDTDASASTISSPGTPANASSPGPSPP